MGMYGAHAVHEDIVSHKHRQRLTDGSQTLYEFRNSNPRALNVMEASGVFATYKLQINYRSNQDILDFANVALDDIEANQFAQIQLHANSLAPTSINSFDSRVILDYHRVTKLEEGAEIFTNVFRPSIVPYIQSCVARGEQVAIIAYAQRDVRRAGDLIAQYMPNMKVANLMPERPFPSDVISRFIRSYWSEVQFIPGQLITTGITALICNRVGDLLGRKATDYAKNACCDLVREWAKENRTLIAEWQQNAEQGVITVDEFFTRLKQNLLDYEIKHNTLKSVVTANKNAERKKAQDVKNANIILSTIHSVKGLEFDNVIVYYKASSQLSQADLRMYYVAFTRAMNSEFIFAFGTQSRPRIVQGHELIRERIIAKAHPQATTPATP